MRSNIDRTVLIVVLLLMPQAAWPQPLRSTARGWAGAWALPFAGYPAVHRRRAAAVPENLASPLRQDRRRLGARSRSPPSPLASGRRPRWRLSCTRMLAEYLSFIVLLFALYTVAGGILITGNLGGTPWATRRCSPSARCIASIVGTTGAAMILVRPLIRANAARRTMSHVMVFFIFLVANIGGALSPLGDPPLFVGFLRGVDFFWPAAASVAADRARRRAGARVLRRGRLWSTLDRAPRSAGFAPQRPIRLRGLINLPLIAASSAPSCCRRHGSRASA